MTLLRVTNSEGSRQCDEHCYAATEPVCTCCCGGVNHGAGIHQALENMREVIQGWQAMSGVVIPLLSDPYYQREAAGQLALL